MLHTNTDNTNFMYFEKKTRGKRGSGKNKTPCRLNKLPELKFLPAFPRQETIFYNAV